MLILILEEVCTKKGFLPAEEYELKHGRKSLDVTLNVRFAGLPNHAKLELVKSQKTRAESEVTIALQVEAARLQHAFPPSTTLWEVIQHWDQQQDSEFKGRLIRRGGDDQQPVLTYMREEVVGDFALQETSLRALGLTGGRALLRLSHRQVDKNVLDSMRESIEKEKSRQEKLKLKARSDNENRKAYEASALGTQATTADHSNNVPMETDTPTQLSTSEAKSQPMEEDVTEVEPVSDQPMEEVVTSGARAAREGRSGETARSRRQRQEESLQGLERLPGVEVIRPDDFNYLSSDDQARARQMAANVFPGIFPQERRAVRPKSTPAAEVYQPPAPNPFANFKFPEATKGQDLYKNELSDVKTEEFLPCDRETCLYSLDEVQQEASTSTSGADIPDDFFEVTVSDVQRMYADLQKNLTTFGDQPLMTSTMRQQAAEERMARYPRVILRIQFPDRLVLQAVFRPRETVFTLQKFVKEHLADKNTPFYLYTTPPKCILKDKSATLYEANLVPMTVVLFGSELQRDHYLSDPVLCEVGPRSKAERIVYTHMADKSGEGTSDSARPRPKRNVPSTSSTGDAPKVPKWFKAGKK